MMKVIFAKESEMGQIPSGIIYYAEDTNQIYIKTDISGELKTYNVDANSDGVRGEVYEFESYNPAGDTKWGEGKVITTGLKAMGKTQVKVIENSVDGFVGKLFWITSSAEIGDTLYALYNDDNGNSAGIKVKLIA